MSSVSIEASVLDLLANGRTWTLCAIAEALVKANETPPGEARDKLALGVSTALAGLCQSNRVLYVRAATFARLQPSELCCSDVCLLPSGQARPIRGGYRLNPSN